FVRQRAVPHFAGLLPAMAPDRLRNQAERAVRDAAVVVWIAMRDVMLIVDRLSRHAMLRPRIRHVAQTSETLVLRCGPHNPGADKPVRLVCGLPGRPLPVH